MTYVSCFESVHVHLINLIKPIQLASYMPVTTDKGPVQCMDNKWLNLRMKGLTNFKQDICHFIRAKNAVQLQYIVTTQLDTTSF